MPTVDDNADAQGNDASNGNNNGEDRVIEASGQSLDDAHAAAQRTFEEEDRKAAADDQGDAGDGDAAADEKNEDKDEESDGDDGSGKDADAGDGDAQGAGRGDGDQNADDTADYKPGSAAIPKAEELKAPEAPVVDSDIEKPGNYKVEFVDVEGNKYYISSAAQLPEDFEPKSQRDYGMSLEGLSEQRAKYATDQKGYETAKADFDNKSTVTELQQGWHTEIQKMTESKTLPDKKEDRDKVVGGVFKLMNDELEKGNAIDSFAIAHELYMSRTGRAEAEAATAEADKAQKAERKNKGGKVMGGGGSRSSAGGGSASGDSSRGRVLEAPPPGTTLDDVHARVMNGIK